MDFDTSSEFNQKLQTFTHMGSLKIVTNYDFKNKYKFSKLKLAIFDLDETLIKGNAFSTQKYQNWDFKHPDVPVVLKEFEAEHYLILIITNQLGISQGYFEFNKMLSFLRSFLQICRIQAFFLIATADDEFRKPAIGSFDYFFEFIENNNIYEESTNGSNKRSISRIPMGLLGPETQRTNKRISKTTSKCEDLKQKNSPVKFKFYWKAPFGSNFALGRNVDHCSFYCGDSAGRINEHLIDFSSCDVLFAINIKINFVLPEQIFLKEAKRSNLVVPSFGFKKQICLKKEQLENEIRKLDELFSSKSNILILLMGPPGCGKSHFTRTYLSEFSQISYVEL